MEVKVAETRVDNCPSLQAEGSMQSIQKVADSNKKFTSPVRLTQTKWVKVDSSYGWSGQGGHQGTRD